ncbi:hypothetical protein INT45_006874 [Circinella minor]|uniref:Uncharacterized protein n=1 Tax=Circinella minor TaxID=1195481 RepID=A0A8H7RY66_9FUNG|nr:hypothetical protein INT45_006874 [Circinella minor]
MNSNLTESLAVNPTASDQFDPATIVPRFAFEMDLELALQIRDGVQEDPFGYELFLHRTQFLVHDLEVWELYDEIHRWQRVKLPVRMKQQIAQIYFKERIPNADIVIKLNVSRRAVCRVLAEWNKIGRAFHLLKNCLCINDYNANEEIYISLM